MDRRDYNVTDMYKDHGRALRHARHSKNLVLKFWCFSDLTVPQIIYPSPRRIRLAARGETLKGLVFSTGGAPVGTLGAKLNSGLSYAPCPIFRAELAERRSLKTGARYHPEVQGALGPCAVRFRTVGRGLNNILPANLSANAELVPLWSATWAASKVPAVGYPLSQALQRLTGI